MTRVTIKAVVAAALTSLEGKEIELCDEAGNVVGWYAPNRPQPTSQELVDSCPTSDEEIGRRLRDEKDAGRTWAEIKRELEAR